MKTLYKKFIFIAIVIRKYFMNFSKNKVAHFSISFSPHSGILVVLTLHDVIKNPMATRNFYRTLDLTISRDLL